MSWLQSKGGCMIPVEAGSELSETAGGVRQLAGKSVDDKGVPLKTKNPSVDLPQTASVGGAALELGKKQAIKESEAVAKEQQIRRTWYILTPEGTLVPAEGFDMEKDPAFRYLSTITRQEGLGLAESPRTCV